MFVYLRFCFFFFVSYVSPEKKVKQAGQCVELNECLSGLHNCDANASCLVSKSALVFFIFNLSVDLAVFWSLVCGCVNFSFSFNF